jgi:potassium efflux system protein
MAGFRTLIYLLLLAGWLLPPAVVAQPRPNRGADSAREDHSHRIEDAYLALGQVNANIRKVADTGEATEELPAVEENLAVLRSSLAQFGAVVNVKQLQTYQVLLTDMQEQLRGWRDGLEVSEKKLALMQAQVAALGRQAALQPPRDSTASELDAAVQKLCNKRQRTAQRLSKNLRKVQELRARVSSGYILTLELQDEVSGKLRKFARNRLEQERNYLWAAPDTVAQPQTSRQAYAGQRKIMGYYLSENWDRWLWLLLIALGFFGWVYRNYKQVNAVAEAPDPEDQPFVYLRPWPVIGALVVALSLAPLFDLQPPPAFLDLQQLLLLLLLSVLIARSWARAMLGYWLAFAALFMALVFANAVAAPGQSLRWWLLGLNLGAAGLGWLFWRRLRGQRTLSSFVRPVTLIFVALNLAAMGFNLFGRLTLMKLCSISAVFGLTQIIGLSIFIQLNTEAFHLQMQRSRLAGGVGAQFNYREIEVELRRALSVVVAGLWLMMLSSNLNLYDRLYRTVSEVLTRTRLIGSTAFTIGNILLFVAILYVSNQLQKYVGYFFGETDDDFSSDLKQKNSRMVAVRLVVLVVGFILAVAASGLPLDKLALVFGALSVGIGLGLQSVVNNLVSGIILIFERPFHVGDFIEVAGKAGRVKDIGIRSSKLITLTGSEVIVPNGDLLSGHVINWTLSNNHIRVEMSLKVDPSTDLDVVRHLIEDEIKRSPNTLHSAPTDILLNAVNGKVYELKVLFWINNIRQEQMVKSEILAGIYQRFTQQGIALH